MNVCMGRRQDCVPAGVLIPSGRVRTKKKCVCVGVEGLHGCGV